MPSCTNTAEFRVGQSADVLYVQFNAHVICDVETSISGGGRKKMAHPQAEMVMGLQTEKDLEDERMRLASDLLFSLFALQHPGLNV